MQKCFKKINHLAAIFLATSLLFGIVIIGLGNDNTVNVKALDYITSGQAYYIKNVKSGKYLTVQHNTATNGTKIIQWKYTGASNQKWIIEWSGDQGAYAGMYRFLTMLNTSKAISMESAVNENGTAAILDSKQNSVKQLFNFTVLNNAAYNITTNASNCQKVLTVNGASDYNNTSIIQYQVTGYGNDQWLIEPASGYDATLAKHYADCNYNRYLKAYPNLTSYSDTGKGKDESFNFVSQCMNAGGKRYYNTDNPITYSLYSVYIDGLGWRINKYNSQYQTPTSLSQFNTSWEVHNSDGWSCPDIFSDYWEHNSTVIGYQKNNLNSTYPKYSNGNIILITKYDIDLDIYIPYDVFVITDNTNATNPGSYLLTTHNSSTLNGNVHNVSLQTVMNNYSDNLLQITVARLHILV